MSKFAGHQNGDLYKTQLKGKKVALHGAGYAMQLITDINQASIHYLLVRIFQFTHVQHSKKYLGKCVSSNEIVPKK
jgi:hypothetical protein